MAPGWGGTAPRRQSGDDVGRITDAVMVEAKRPGSKCNVGKALAGMSDVDAAELEQVLDVASPGGPVSYSAITRFLRSEGFEVGGNAVSNHCGGSCSCGPRS